jgi:AcrR family transcriptional regulator
VIVERQRYDDSVNKFVVGVYIFVSTVYIWIFPCYLPLMAIRVPRKRADAYQHGDLRHALIQAGLKLLAEGGARELSLRAAAQLAGVSHAAPYRHFKDKDALMAAIAEEGFRLLTRRMQEEIAAASDDVLARLRASAVGYVSFAVEHPAHFRTIFGGAVCEEGKPSSLQSAGEEAFNVLRNLIVEGIGAGRLRGDPDQLALASWSMVHGLAMLIIDRQVESALAAGIPTVTEMVSRLLERGTAAP